MREHRFNVSQEVCRRIPFLDRARKYGYRSFNPRANRALLPLSASNVRILFLLSKSPSMYLPIRRRRRMSIMLISRPGFSLNQGKPTSMSLSLRSTTHWLSPPKRFALSCGIPLASVHGSHPISLRFRSAMMISQTQERLSNCFHQSMAKKRFAMVVLGPDGLVLLQSR